MTVLVVLLVFPRLERSIDHNRESRPYRLIIAASNMEKFDHIQHAEKFVLQMTRHQAIHHFVN